jgi:hypothetical protein
MTTTVLSFTTRVCTEVFALVDAAVPEDLIVQTTSGGHRTSFVAERMHVVIWNEPGEFADELVMTLSGSRLHSPNVEASATFGVSDRTGENSLAGGPDFAVSALRDILPVQFRHLLPEAS